MIKQFDGTNLKSVRADIQAALQVVEMKHGIKLSIGNISYTNNSFTTKLSAVLTQTNEAGEEVGSGVSVKWQASFHKHCHQYGLKSSDLGRTVMMGGIQHVLVGMRPKANQPMVLQKPSGAFIACYADAVTRGLQ